MPHGLRCLPGRDRAARRCRQPGRRHRRSEQSDADAAAGDDYRRRADPGDAIRCTARRQPTISAAQILDLLATPPDPAAGEAGLRYDPFTLITNRARSKMTSYVAQRGDTIAGIANRYGLKKESIAWCNDYRLALVLRPGDIVNIPPTDGACHTVIRTQSKDIRAIAEQYKIDDPYAIIDSSANELPDIAPETLLPSGTRLFIPGGEGEIITWNAPVQQDGAGNVVAFDPGSPFSCGARSGGGTRWVNPLPNGTYVRGYYAGHSGIDISAPTGTPIYAANGGPILYAGWNNWGYGITVVIGHGPWSTLYGHMSSRAVGCGQVVGAGQIIGYVGSTGNSSGPHLHFEIRFRNQPQDPAATSGLAGNFPLPKDSTAADVVRNATGKSAPPSLACWGRGLRKDSIAQYRIKPCRRDLMWRH